MKKIAYIHRERKSGSKKTIFLWPQLSVSLPPQWALAKISLLRTYSNISRKVSRPAVGTVGPAQILIWPYSTLYLLPKPTVATEFHSFKCGDTHCLLRYSTDAGFTKTMGRIHATTLGTAWANPLRPVWSHSSWCSALLLSQPLFVGRPPLSVPCSDKRGQ